MASKRMLQSISAAPRTLMKSLRPGGRPTRILYCLKMRRICGPIGRAPKRRLSERFSIFAERTSPSMENFSGGQAELGVRRPRTWQFPPAAGPRTKFVAALRVYPERREWVKLRASGLQRSWTSECASTLLKIKLILQARHNEGQRVFARPNIRLTWIKVIDGPICIKAFIVQADRSHVYGSRVGAIARPS